MFNSTILLGLILSNYMGNQPLITLPNQNLPSSLSVSSFRFTSFSNSAIFSRSDTKLKVERSFFTLFTRTPIVITRPNIDGINYSYYTSRQVCNSECPVFASYEIREVTFQTCSTIIYDQPSGDNSINVSGGAMYINTQGHSCNILITQCNFLYCHAGQYGGALYIDHEHSQIQDTVIISFTYFQNCDVGFILNKNAINKAAGGAIYCISHNLEITGCNFSHCGIDFNTTDETYGGAIYADLSEKLLIRFSNFSQCSTIPQKYTVYGGAIYAKFRESNPDPTVDIHFTNFSNCIANETSVMHLQGNLYNVSVYFSYFDFCTGAKYVINVNNTNDAQNCTVRFNNLSLNIHKSLNFSMITKANYPGLLVSQEIYIRNDKGDYDQDHFLPAGSFPGNTISNKSTPNYPYIIPLKEADLYVPFPTTPSSDSPTVTEPTAIETSPNKDSDVSNSGDGSPTNTGDDGVVDENSGGLSTVAIVLIILACLVVLAIIIIAIIFCVKRGVCSESQYRVQDIRYLGQGDAIRETTYF